jgi:integrase
MARRIADRTLDSREARRKLKAQGKPYWRGIERGLHLGYRRLAGAAGRWIARHYLGGQRYAEEQLGIADDLTDADRVVVLDYWQAVEAARERLKVRAHAAVGKSGPYTVADAVAAYLEFLTRERKSAYQVRIRMSAHVLPGLGEIEVAKLTADKLRRWHSALAEQPARLRSRADNQKYRELSDDEEAVRRRRASANVCLSQLKAALNLAFNEGKAPSDTAWRKVKPFRAVNAARDRYLSIGECKRLLNACPLDFRQMVRAALETGARYGELARLTVGDYNPDVGTVAIRVTKTSKPRHVVLTADGVAFFAQCCAGRAASEPLFRKTDGKVWGKSHQGRPMRAACERAHIDPPINFHGLRHTWASLSVMNGLPLIVAARNLGHAGTAMVEKHYGHLAPSYVADAIREHAPKFGKTASNVRVLK